jgi:hypothetical protein
MITLKDAISMLVDMIRPRLTKDDLEDMVLMFKAQQPGKSSDITKIKRVKNWKSKTIWDRIG